MDEKEKEITRWATQIIPAVFNAEFELLECHPEWSKRMTNQVRSSEEFCKAIAAIIVSKGAKYEVMDNQK